MTNKEVNMATKKKIDLKEFFEKIPPGVNKNLSINTYEQHQYGTQLPSKGILLPEITIFCSSDSCNGDRIHDSKDEISVLVQSGKKLFITYVCRNCKKNVKVFSIILSLQSETEAVIYKFGELPKFGERLPSKLIALFGKDRDLFLKGWECEKEGLGIGAFSYYRRVVENQTGKIFDEIIRALKTLTGTGQIISELETAKKQIQFTSAVDHIKKSLPELLYIDGHNPLTLLHKALSEGIHILSDEDCLELATSIRQVLSALIEKVSFITVENKELKSAVTKLLNRKKSK